MHRVCENRALSRLALGLGAEAFLIGVGVYVLLRAPAFGGLLAAAGRGPRTASLALIAGFVVLDLGGIGARHLPVGPVAHVRRRGRLGRARLRA